MDLSVESWYGAIFIRKSRRSFDEQPVDAAVLDGLGRRFASFHPFPGARVALVPRPPEAVLRGLVGNYGRITGAPAYAAFIGEADAPLVHAAVGYAGEAFILEATVLGLATCWVSGFFRPDAVRAHIHVAPSERVFAVTPVGRAVEELTRRDRIYRALAHSASRKPLSELMEAAGTPLEPWQQKAFEAARLAPSAGNRQPWRFSAGPGYVEIGASGGRDNDRFSKRLDCGIAMLHLELAARAGGKRGAWAWLEYPRVARYEINV
jgi:nitroreductase